MTESERNGKDALKGLITESARSRMDLASMLWSAGYRLDPYVNGKSKDELIDIIATKQAELDKTRNLLRAEHEWAIKSSGLESGYTAEESMDRHRKNKANCSVCSFLADTSEVKE